MLGRGGWDGPGWATGNSGLNIWMALSHVPSGSRSWMRTYLPRSTIGSSSGGSIWIV